ncbi:MAG: hypothetical protein COA78_18515 [Blastopirellula sp.]|nr:MAG: hypothetical protein COA78_18515 [Blastopirellula sp.]
MSVSDLATLPDDTDSPEVTTINLADYRSKEMVDQLVELISVPSAIGKVFFNTLLLIVGIPVACYSLFSSSTLSLLGWVFLGPYSLVLGLIFGIILGLLRVISTAMKNVESILSMILDITDRAALDYDQLRTGNAKLPTGPELVEQVYEQVMLPMLEQAVKQAFSIFSYPILFIYRRSIHSAVRFMIKRVQRFSKSKPADKEIEVEVISTRGKIAKYSDTIKKYTSSAKQWIAHVGGKLRFYAMRPMYVVYIIAMLVALLPVGLLRYWASGSDIP